MTLVKLSRGPSKAQLQNDVHFAVSPIKSRGGGKVSIANFGKFQLPNPFLYGPDANINPVPDDRRLALNSTATAYPNIDIGIYPAGPNVTVALWYWVDSWITDTTRPFTSSTRYPGVECNEGGISYRFRASSNEDRTIGVLGSQARTSGYHLFIARHKTGDRSAVYVDDVFEGDTSRQGWAINATDASIGREVNNIRLSELILFDRALDAPERSWLYQIGPGGLFARQQSYFIPLVPALPAVELETSITDADSLTADLTVEVTVVLEADLAEADSLTAELSVDRLLVTSIAETDSLTADLERDQLLDAAVGDLDAISVSLVVDPLLEVSIAETDTLVANLRGAYAGGVNFRATAGFVADGPDDVPALEELYPTTKTNAGGFDVVYGWSATNVLENDLLNTNPPELAGHHSTDSPTTVFRLDLPEAGTYLIDAAFGNPTLSVFTGYELRDGDGAVIQQYDITETGAGDRYRDATNVLRTSAADWQNNRALLTHTFVNDYLTLRVRTDATMTLQRMCHISVATPSLIPDVELEANFAEVDDLTPELTSYLELVLDPGQLEDQDSLTPDLTLDLPGDILLQVAIAETDDLAAFIGIDQQVETGILDSETFAPVLVIERPLEVSIAESETFSADLFIDVLISTSISDADSITAALTLDLPADVALDALWADQDSLAVDLTIEAQPIVPLQADLADTENLVAFIAIEQAVDTGMLDADTITPDLILDRALNVSQGDLDTLTPFLTIEGEQIPEALDFTAPDVITYYTARTGVTQWRFEK